MVGLNDIIGILKRWDEWKRIEASPSRLDALEKRVAELEGKLKRAPGDACPKCGELDFRVQRTAPAGMLGSMGVRTHYMKCGVCGFEDQRTIAPK